ncbi:MAG TPA: formate dehydrogenase accessory sulfurtransferase FdhD [Ktedonobacteraceae bacterium]|nr:formate dehydrogenase accessory sulfurtransferase FdhD [Ktedonobacteraceae bacterium]
MSLSWRSPLDPERVLQVSITHWHRDEQQQKEDQVTVEEPLEIRIAGRNLAIIMRTPGHDYELALGFLFSEGVIQNVDEIHTIENALDDDGLPLANVVNVVLSNQGQQAALSSQPTAFERHFAVSASCGLCGKNSITDLLHATCPLEPDNLHIATTILYELAQRLRAQQAVFSHTGGLHAAGLFTPDGELLLLREDIGRHNAVDKLVGYSLFHGLYPCRQHILVVSGRTSFEILQKALLARIPCVVAISAPSSLAIELAERGGITLIGFLRDQSLNVYTHPQRVV